MVDEVDTETCPRCRGSGSDWGQGREDCPKCQGFGRIRHYPDKIYACVRCDTSGRLSDRQGGWIECRVCHGYGMLESVLPPENPPGSDIWFVRAGTPYSQRQRLAGVLEDLRGDVCVCDPYFGSGVIRALTYLKECDTVRCLTRDFEKGVGKKGAEQEIGEFKTEYPNAEFRQSTSGDLHDRYVLTDDRLLILGQGLKDFGKDDSFVITLDDVFARMRSNRWRPRSRPTGRRQQHSGRWVRKV